MIYSVTGAAKWEEGKFTNGSKCYMITKFTYQNCILSKIFLNYILWIYSYIQWTYFFYFRILKSVQFVKSFSGRWSILLFFFFPWESELGRGQWQRENLRLHAQGGIWCRARYHYPGIKIWAKFNSWMFNQLSHSAASTILFLKKQQIQRIRGIKQCSSRTANSLIWQKNNTGIKLWKDWE